MYGVCRTIHFKSSVVIPAYVCRRLKEQKCLTHQLATPAVSEPRQVDAVRDPEGARAELGIPGALTSAPEPQWEEEAQRILEILGLKGKR